MERQPRPGTEAESSDELDVHVRHDEAGASPAPRRREGGEPGPGRCHFSTRK